MPGGVELSEKLPDEIFQLVESFKKFVREQKAFRDQKMDIEPMLEIDKDADEFMLAFQRVAVDSEINKQLIQKIRDETTKLLRHAELAYSLLRSYIANNPTQPPLQQQQHQQQQQQQQQQQPQQTNSMSSLFGTTFNLNNPTNPNQQQHHQQQHQTSQMNTTGISLPSNNLTNLNGQQNDSFNQTSSHHNQFASTSSSQYFAELADQFEVRMKAYGEQIKELKLSLDSVIKTYNADELFKWLKKQHETLGEIAAKVYMTHERILEKKSELM